MQAERDQPNQNTDFDAWLSLHEASALLGVAASTLRRWGDSGRVPMKRTLGGHRRFARDIVLKLAGTQSAPIAGLLRRSAEAPRAWGVDERELVQQAWHARLAARPGADRMRGLGQRLLGMLIQYLNRREDEERLLSEAHGVGANYGREASAATFSLHDTVEAFLFFRNAFSELAPPVPGIAQPTDLVEAAALQARLNRFMDSILLGLIAGYEGEGAIG